MNINAEGSSISQDTGDNVSTTMGDGDKSTTDVSRETNGNKITSTGN